MAKESANPSATTYPPYLQMISEAISALKEPSGSSQPGITKFIEDKYAKALPSNFRRALPVQMKKLVESGDLAKTKNSYMLSSKEEAEISRKEVNVEKIGVPEQKKGSKTKRLSQVKTPEVLKSKKGQEKPKAEGQNHQTAGKKLKRLSQVKTPEALKKPRKK